MHRTDDHTREPMWPQIKSRAHKHGNRKNNSNPEIKLIYKYGI